jgi:hypothetical protein
MLGMAAPEVCQQEAEGSQAQPGMLSSDLFILVYVYRYHSCHTLTFGPNPIFSETDNTFSIYCQSSEKVP